VVKGDFLKSEEKSWMQFNLAYSGQMVKWAVALQFLLPFFFPGFLPLWCP
jgi:hypothetical protein